MLLALFWTDCPFKYYLHFYVFRSRTMWKIGLIKVNQLVITEVTVGLTVCCALIWSFVKNNIVTSTFRSTKTCNSKCCGVSLAFYADAFALHCFAPSPLFWLCAATRLLFLISYVIAIANAHSRIRAIRCTICLREWRHFFFFANRQFSQRNFKGKILLLILQ